jgi:hypothetical protein
MKVEEMVHALLAMPKDAEVIITLRDREGNRDYHNIHPEIENLSVGMSGGNEVVMLRALKKEKWENK